MTVPIIDDSPTQPFLSLDVKTCKRCGQTKSLQEFYQSPNRPGRSNLCNDCRPIDGKERREQMKIRNTQNPPIVIEKRCSQCKEVKPASDFSANICKSDGLKKYNQEVKRKVLSHYSGGTMACACCGETHIEFLTIDHVNNDGAAHRRAIKTPLYGWLLAHDYPPGFQVLCMNCNFSKGKFGYCPHAVPNAEAA